MKHYSRILVAFSRQINTERIIIMFNISIAQIGI